MMIDLSTMRSLELIENLQNAKSRDCLYGLLNQTLTPMGARLLKSTVLQPSTDKDILEKRWDALAELTAKEDVFFAIRQGKFGVALQFLLLFTCNTNHAACSEFLINSLFSYVAIVRCHMLTPVLALKAFVDVDRVLTAV
jgi:hypothetical protein